jgi:hypothetical protein
MFADVFVSAMITYQATLIMVFSMMLTCGTRFQRITYICSGSQKINLLMSSYVYMTKDEEGTVLTSTGLIYLL